MPGLRPGDRVRWIGPLETDVMEGELGWLTSVEEDTGESIVAWDIAGAEVVGDLTMLEKVGDRNEPDPYKRLPGDPLRPR